MGLLVHIRRRFLLPAARMGRPPRLHAQHLLRPAEVIPVLRLGPPLALGSDPTGPSTARAGAIALVVAVAVVRIVHPTTATALATTGGDAHDAAEPEENGRGLHPNHAADRKKKWKKQKGSLEESSEEGPTEKKSTSQPPRPSTTRPCARSGKAPAKRGGVEARNSGLTLEVYPTSLAKNLA